MRSSTTPLLALLTACLLASPSSGELCAIDDVPAATLLVPYFEVDLGRARKVDTVVSIQNTTEVATVAHVTLWTNWGVPTLSFDVFLTGFDTQKIDLYDVLVNGRLPQTAHAANDPDDSISPHGNNPIWDSAPDSIEPEAGRFEDCDTVLPPAPLAEALAGRLRASHTGRDTGEGCVGANLGDNLARGYVTVDNVTDCNLLFPGEEGYFGSSGVASDVNQLRGEYYITERSGKGMAVAQAVAVEAGRSAGGSATFYQRYLNGTGTDGREPLASIWAARWPDRMPFGRSTKAVETDLIVWRDTDHNDLGATYECGVETPPWLPLEETQVVAFSEQMDAAELCFDSGGDNGVSQACAPLATQRLRLGSGDLQSPVGRGWLYLLLEPSPQSFLSQLTSVRRLRSNTPGSALNSACD